ncbi:MAG: MerR family DNA-binding transcriptional regulator [Phycisphaeraceae bacterium]
MAELETRTFSIGVLTRRFNVSAESLRNWERAGLIPPAHRTPGGHRRYRQDHIDAVHKLLYAPAVELGNVDRDPDGDDYVSAEPRGEAVMA